MCISRDAATDRQLQLGICKGFQSSIFPMQAISTHTGTGEFRSCVNGCIANVVSGFALLVAVTTHMKFELQKSQIHTDRMGTYLAHSDQTEGFWV